MSLEIWCSQNHNPRGLLSKLGQINRHVMEKTNRGITMTTLVYLEALLFFMS
jgi:hypothetical protein